MKLGFNEATALECKGQSLMADLEMCEKYGFDYIEIRFDCVKDYLKEHTLEELAERLCVTDEYLSTLIKKETGMSFTETLRKVRIERMKELLLHSGLKLNQIAEMVGYSDPKYMSKVFKEEVGMLPAQFRKQNH